MKHENPRSTAPGLVRLQRYLAMAGVESRRHCEEFILTGRVTVDRQVVRELGTRIDPDEQEVRLDGERIRVERQVYYLLNKPIGYLCTNRDPDGRPRVIDLFPKDRERLFTVGRLDEHSQGLILVTNDGELANRLAHPRFRVRKVYHVQVAGVPTREIVKQLTEGLYFPEGRFKAAEARLVKIQKQSAVLEIVLTEGQNREIRRLLAKLGHKVQRLQRVTLGPLELGVVPPGHFRPLSPSEVRELKALVQEGQLAPRKKSAAKPRNAANRHGRPKTTARGPKAADPGRSRRRR
ncbi:MAG: rRNA pseudouridine synthase [Planctomycetaceae bacterium]|nr:rRNA pseudouridine synthase [Planctomycetaceae bacterium]